MMKRLITLCIALSLSLFAAFAAAVEVNTADQAALESVKGIGPVHAKAIIEERTKNGPFKDADDLANRVKGIGPKSVVNLEAAGLTINGSSKPPSGKTATEKKKAPVTSAPSTAAPAATAPPVTAPSSASSTAGKKKSKRGKAASAASGA